MAEKQNQSSDRSEAVACGSESQPAAPISTCDRLKPVTLNNEVQSASSEMLGDKTDSEIGKRPVEQESERDTLICQQIGSGEAVPVPPVGVAVKQGLSRSLAQRQSSCDGEEKRDQSKEEPLEMKQQEGELKTFGRRPWIIMIRLKLSLFDCKTTPVCVCVCVYVKIPYDTFLWLVEKQWIHPKSTSKLLTLVLKV